MDCVLGLGFYSSILIASLEYFIFLHLATSNPKIHIK